MGFKKRDRYHFHICMGSYTYFICTSNIYFSYMYVYEKIYKNTFCVYLYVFRSPSIICYWSLADKVQRRPIADPQS